MPPAIPRPRGRAQPGPSLGSGKRPVGTAHAWGTCAVPTRKLTRRFSAGGIAASQHNHSRKLSGCLTCGELSTTFRWEGERFPGTLFAPFGFDADLAADVFSVCSLLDCRGIFRAPPASTVSRAKAWTDSPARLSPRVADGGGRAPPRVFRRPREAAFSPRTGIDATRERRTSPPSAIKAAGRPQDACGRTRPRRRSTPGGMRRD